MMLPATNTGRVLAVALLCLFTAAAFGQDSQPPTDQERSDFRHVREQYLANPEAELDLRDPINYRYLVRKFERAGYTRKRYPQLFRSLERLSKTGPAPLRKTAAATGTTEPVNMIMEVKTNDQTTFHGQALSSIPQGSEATYLILGLYDENDSPIGKVERLEQFDGGRDVLIEADGAFPTPTTTPRLVQAVGEYFYEDHAGAQHAGPIMSASAFYPKAIQDDAPIPIKSPSQIVVCLNRTVQNSDCDYDCSTGLNCAKQTPSDWQVRFPLKGYVDYFKNIDVNEQGKPAGATARIVVTFPGEGGGCKLPFEGFYDNPNTKVVNQTRLQWSLDPAVFGNACYPGKSDVNFGFSITVYTEETPISAFINNTGKTPAQNTYKLPAKFRIYQGCLAPGSRIALADGTDRVIERFDGGEKVRSENGRTLTVAGTMFGTEAKPLVHITTASGLSLRMTEDHPVPTTTGVRLARQLRAGESVYTSSGTERLKSVRRETYNGIVHNLDVGVKQDAVALTNENRTFYANGILVGDGQMQAYWQRIYDRVEVRRKLPRKWAIDYHSAIEDHTIDTSQ